MSRDDRDAILRLMVRYGRAVDFRDAAALQSVFADPFEFDVSAFTGTPPARLTPAQFAETTLRILGGVQTLHQIGNPDIEVEGQVARGCFNMAARHFRARPDAPGGGVEYVMYGFYSETFRRLEGQWKIERHHLLKAYCTGDPGIFGG